MRKKIDSYNRDHALTKADVLEIGDSSGVLQCAEKIPGRGRCEFNLVRFNLIELIVG